MMVFIIYLYHFSYPFIVVSIYFAAFHNKRYLEMINATVVSVQWVFI